MNFADIEEQYSDVQYIYTNNALCQKTGEPFPLRALFKKLVVHFLKGLS